VLALNGLQPLKKVFLRFVAFFRNLFSHTESRPNNDGLLTPEGDAQVPDGRHYSEQFAFVGENPKPERPVCPHTSTSWFRLRG
jgi:hypothetical protein